MGKLKGTGVSWPPVDWKQFSNISKASDQAISKDISAGKVIGISYAIDSHPLYELEKGQQTYYAHHIHIDGWEYQIQTDSIEHQILSFTLLDRHDVKMPKETYISKIKSMGGAVVSNERSARRAVTAAVFLIKQINAGQVPDAERVLKIYKLHPSQSRIYEQGHTPTDMKGRYYSMTREFGKKDWQSF